MYPRDYFETHGSNPEPGRVFILMPFEDGFAEIYRTLQDVLEGDNVCFRCVRADELYGSRNVMSEILEEISRAEVVVADVTGRNPNVFYELGIAHTILPSDKVIIITQDDDDVPFDIQQYRYLRYESSTTGLETFRGKITETIRRVAQRSVRFAATEGVLGSLQRPLLGPDRWLYSVQVPDILVGEDFAKFHLVVTRSGLEQEPSTEVHNNTWALQRGEGLRVPGLGWALLLEDIDGPTASFRLAPSANINLRNVDDVGA